MMQHQQQKSPPLVPPNQEQNHKIKRRPVPGSRPPAEEVQAHEPPPPPIIELTAPTPAPATASAAVQEPRRGISAAVDAVGGTPAMEFRWYCDMYPLHPACCEMCFPGARATSVPGTAVSSIPAAREAHPRRGGQDNEEVEPGAPGSEQQGIWGELWGGLRQRHSDASPPGHTGSVAPLQLPPLPFQAVTGHGDNSPCLTNPAVAGALQELPKEYGWCVDIGDEETGMILEPAAETQRRGLPGRFEGSRYDGKGEKGWPPTPPPPKDR